jgi:hypothetical protein
VVIEEDLRSWSREVLEVPNKSLNGLPACPYAREAWKQNKVRVVETDHIGVETILQANKFNNNQYELVVVASYKFPTPYQFTDFIGFLNDTYSWCDLHIMGFHPEYGAEEADLDFLYDHDWASSIEEEYAMMFIQSLSQVDDASLKLEKLGYYNVYPKEEYEALVLERRQRRNRKWQ